MSGWTGACEICGKAVPRPKPSRIKSGRGRFCSRECGGRWAISSREIRYRGVHGQSRTALHDIWMGIRSRCEKPSTNGYKHYGGRGIKVCERWQSFENFAADMGPRPSPSHSVDRIDHNGDYCPENCRWATHAEQLRNTRRTHKVEYGGKEYCVTDLAAHLGVDMGTLRYRMRAGWPRERWGRPPSYLRG